MFKDRGDFDDILDSLGYSPEQAQLIDEIELTLTIFNIVITKTSSESREPDWDQDSIDASKAGL